VYYDDLYKPLQKTCLASNLREIKVILRYVYNDIVIWSAFGANNHREGNSLKAELSNISIRRNQIAHESDYSSVLMGRQQITKSEVEDVIVFLRQIGDAICQLVI
jgi:hypothetical protein